MAFPYRRVLCPYDFDQGSSVALDTAVRIVQQNQGTIFLLHVVPVAVPPGETPIYFEAYRDQERQVHQKLDEVAQARLDNVKYETLTHIGDPGRTIVRFAQNLAADLVVMATHKRHGLARIFPGNVTTLVLRDASCPVLIVHHGEPDRNVVSRWMIRSPFTAIPDQSLSSISTAMRQSRTRCIPVIENGKIVGVLSDEDMQRHADHLEQAPVSAAMHQAPAILTPDTDVHEAARLLLKHKAPALPVAENGRLAGLITIAAVLHALVDRDRG